MKRIICPQCHSELENDSDRCLKCGTDLTSDKDKGTSKSALVVGVAFAIVIVVVIAIIIFNSVPMIQEQRKIEESRIAAESQATEEIGKAYEESRRTRESSIKAVAESQKAEASKATEESRKAYENLQRNTIKVSNIHTSKPNSAGGVDLYATFTNVSGKTIKYIYFTATAYNAVDDPVSCEIRMTSNLNCSYTGPLYSGSNTSDIYWDCLWYNSTIKYAKITDVSVEFMDGTTVDIPDEYL